MQEFGEKGRTHDLQGSGWCICGGRQWGRFPLQESMGGVWQGFSIRHKGLVDLCASLGGP